ncbi:Spermidine synthase [Thelohanellus kitauei]|uniref:Spermidine synthase n=1 Tax=Thelohanellus kitauei TaxID=669202 RepID=A0A0C2IP47_THEKT|nr:Spermidine synthase [Thelohanellus kitauei]
MPTMNLKLENGYFYDHNIFEPSCSNVYSITKILFHDKSKFFDIAILCNEKFGNILVLDGSVQLSEWDEFVYHEMITFLPTNSHLNPRDALVLGGGDGGTLRELDRHPKVQNVTLCELDEVSKKYLTKTSIGLESPKANIIIIDAFEFLSKTHRTYDVIICDLNDPRGHSEKLYMPECIDLMDKHLKTDGILCMQSECIWDSLDFIVKIIKTCKRYFATVKYATVSSPIYNFGQIGFLLCTNSKTININEPLFQMDPSKYGLRYYSPSIHRACFILPPFVQKTIDELT